MGKIVGIQYLRALAATMVVVFHMGGKVGLPFKVGSAGVDIFFVISGFIMWSVTNRDGVSPGDFLLKRIKRIVPNYWLATTAYLVLAAVGLFPRYVLDPWYAVASYLFVPVLMPNSDRIWPVAVQGWTLNYEMMFYLLFAAGLTLRRGARLPAVGGVLVLLAAAGAVAGDTGTLVHFYTRPIILEFAIGMGLARLWSLGLLANRPAGTLAVALGFALLLAMEVAWLPAGSATTMLMATLVVAGTLAVEGSATDGRPSVPALEYLGDASYSIYLWHPFGIFIATKVLDRFGVPAWIDLVAGVIGGIALGVAAYELVEKPMLRMLFRKREAAAPAQVATGP